MPGHGRMVLLTRNSTHSIYHDEASAAMANRGGFSDHGSFKRMAKGSSYYPARNTSGASGAGEEHKKPQQKRKKRTKTKNYKNKELRIRTRLHHNRIKRRDVAVGQLGEAAIAAYAVILLYQ